jgi:hypothetical protein
MKIEPSTSLRDSTSRSVGSERRAPGPYPRAEATTPTSTPSRGPNHGPEPLNASPSVEFPKRGRLVTVARARVSTIRARLAAAAGIGVWLGALGCLPDEERGDRRFEPPALARPAAVPPAAPYPRARRAREPLEYALGPSNHVTFLLQGRQRRLEGKLPLAAGRLWLDGLDLGSTRAELTFDLAAIQLWDARSNPAPEGADGATLTEQSLDWLQLSREQDVRARPELRYARFTLLAIGSSSSNDLDAAPTVRSGQSAGVARRVRLRASGELELHGRRLPQTVSLDARFEWDGDAEPAAPPSRVVLETSEPLEIDLLGHGVVPRDSRGEQLADGLAELRRQHWKPLQVRARWLAELAVAEPPIVAPGAGRGSREP